MQILKTLSWIDCFQIQNKNKGRVYIWISNLEFELLNQYDDLKFIRKEAIFQYKTQLQVNKGNTHNVI